jgi:hypothetical protein
VLHTCVSEVAEHSSPPQALLSCTIRVRVCEPVSQFLLHSPHEVHGFILQLTGQQPVLQSCASCRAPHGVPPQSGSSLIVRVRVVRPPPQDFEHVLHTDHSCVSQAFGQQPVLQALVSDKGGQSSPPYKEICSMWRVRVC